MKTFVAIILSAIALTFISGCAGTLGGNTSGYDKFQGVVVNRMYNNDLPQPFPETGSFQLNARQEITNGGQTNYFIVLTYLNLQGGFVVTQPGESLIFLVDGERIGLQKRLSFDVSQGVFYSTTEDVIKKIATAKAVEVRIMTVAGNVDKKFTNQNIENYRKFVARFIDNSIQPVQTTQQQKIASPKGL